MSARTTYPNDEELKVMQKTFPSDEELKTMQSTAIVVDVRPAPEVIEKGTSVPGSVNIPFVTAEQDSFLTEDVFAMLPSDKSALIITHWNGGGRAARVQAHLQVAGFTNVHNGQNADRINRAFA